MPAPLTFDDLVTAEKAPLTFDDLANEESYEEQIAPFKGSAEEDIQKRLDAGETLDWIPESPKVNPYLMGAVAPVREAVPEIAVPDEGSNNRKPLLVPPLDAAGVPTVTDRRKPEPTPEQLAEGAARAAAIKARSAEFEAMKRPVDEIGSRYGENLKFNKAVDQAKAAALKAEFGADTIDIDPNPVAALGSIAKTTGRTLAGATADVFENAARAKGEDEPFYSNVLAALKGEKMPVEETIERMPFWAGLGPDIAYKGIELAPQIAASAVLAEFGVPLPLAAGLPFAVTEHGLNLKEGAKMAAFPFASKAGAAIFEKAATKLGIKLGSKAALDALKVAGGVGGAVAWMHAISLPDYKDMTPEERRKAIIKNTAMVLAFEFSKAVGVAKGSADEAKFNAAVDEAVNEHAKDLALLITDPGHAQMEYVGRPFAERGRPNGEAELPALPRTGAAAAAMRGRSVVAAGEARTILQDILGLSTDNATAMLSGKKTPSQVFSEQFPGLQVDDAIAFSESLLPKVAKDRLQLAAAKLPRAAATVGKMAGEEKLPEEPPATFAQPGGLPPITAERLPPAEPAPPTAPTPPDEPPKPPALPPPPEEPAKPSELKVGDLARIMDVPSVLAQTETIDGIRYELFKGARADEQRATIRVTDVDSGKVSTLTQHPTFETAEATFSSAVRHAKAQAGAESVAESIAKAQAQVDARRAKYRDATAKLPDGTEIAGWKKETIDGDVFWTKNGQKGTTDVLVEAGQKAVDEALAQASQQPPGKLDLAEPEAPTDIIPENENAEKPLPPGKGSPEASDAGTPEPTTLPAGPPDSGPVGGGQPGVRPGTRKGGKPAPTPEGSAGPAVGGTDPSPAGGGELPPGGPRDTGDVRHPPVSTLNPKTDYTITAADRIGVGGLKEKYTDNVAAIRLVMKLRAEGRSPTPEEKAVLVRYVGWGGLKFVFDGKNKQWKAQYAELKSLLPVMEYDAARASVLNAHYTSETIIVDGIYRAVQRFGFPGGRVLEGGVGIGHLYGLMPHDMRGRSSYMGVELDPITAEIAKHLYPHADIKGPRGFEKLALPSDYFDASWGNPPFGTDRVVDAQHKDISKFTIHNFFIAKSLDKTRPGGIGVFVVSNGFLDAADSQAREWIAARADFLGAIRLPNDAFKANANTEVTTDIVFFRKRAPDTKPDDASWVKSGTVPDPKGGEAIPLNPYFIEHPEMMLGKMTRAGTMYGPGQPALIGHEGQDLAAALRAAVDKLPEGFYVEAINPMAVLPDVTASVPEGAKVGGYYVLESGGIGKRLPDVADRRRGERVEFGNETAPLRAAGMIKVRDAYNTLLHAEGTDEPAQVLTKLRAKLNKEYDAFVKKFGYLNAKPNRAVFREDPDYPRMSALERDYDEGLSENVAKKEGVPPRAPSASKADIFSRRVRQPYKEVTSAGSAKEGLMVSLNQRGAADIEYIAKLTGLAPDKIADDLHGLVFKNPEGGWQAKDQYLSGNVKAKLVAAKAAAARDSSYAPNVEALLAVQPKDVPPHSIDFRLGAPWVRDRDIADFTRELVGVDPETASYQPAAGRWFYKLRDRTIHSIQTWGTEDVPFGDIMEHLLSNTPIVVRENAGTSKDPQWVVLVPETTAANEKADAVQQKFKDWLWKDPTRRDALARIYNDAYNTDVRGAYDGSHLTFPGKNPDIELRPSQGNGAWRIILDRRALLDHVVGAGKTYTGIAAIMEMRRLGLVRKAMFVVPNHLVRQWRDEFTRLYPNANILAAEKADFERENREKFFGRIANGDWDAVIVAHSSFGRIGLPHEKLVEVLREQMEDLTTAIEALKVSEGEKSKTVRQMEQMRARLLAKMEKAIAATGAKSPGTTFDQLGVDALFVDEAHEFKNLAYYTQMKNISGLGSPEGSGKAFDLFVKLRWLQDAFGGRGTTVFATGTPISNSLVEAYTMQRFLQYRDLKEKGLNHLDAWANVFADVGMVHEVDPTGTRYRSTTRFAFFHNMSELKRLSARFTDTVTMNDLIAQAEAQGKVFPIPKIKGGKPQNVVVDRSPAQALYMGLEEPVMDEGGAPKLDADGNPLVEYTRGSILWRIAHMPRDKREDNMLKITNDARKAALDYRLIDANAPDHPTSKANRATTEIKRIYDAWHADKGTQLVFCDLSTPKSDRGKATAKAAKLEAERLKRLEKGDDAEEDAPEEDAEGVSMDELLADTSDFSVYDDLRAKLIATGIPEHEIAFIHDYGTDLQKVKLFAAVNRGDIRVLIGSTKKMGAGMNVNQRMVALHHLDAPWRPSDLEQREGRIVRQGNKLYLRDPKGFEVEIMRYATDRTYDTRMWQLIELKAGGIEQHRNADDTVRRMEDVSGEAANAGEMKAAASGNPMIVEEIKLRMERRKLEALKTAHDSNEYSLEQQITRLAHFAERYADSNARWERVKAYRDANTPEKFEIKIGDMLIKDKKDVEAPLVQLILASKKNQVAMIVGVYRGMGISIATYRDHVAFHVNPTGRSGSPNDTTEHIANYFESDKFSGPGFIQRLDNWINDEPDAALARSKAQRDREESQLTELKSVFGKPFARQAELDAVRQRHSAVQTALRSGQRSPTPPPAQRAGPGARTLGTDFPEGSPLGVLTGAVRAQSISPKQTIGERLQAAKENFTDAFADRTDQATAALGRLRVNSLTYLQALKRPAEYSNFQRTLGNWSGADNRTALDIQRWVQTIRRVVPLAIRRDAMTNWIQAEGDVSVLRMRAALSKGRLKRGYEAALTLNNEEITLARNISSYLEARLEEGIEADMLKSGIENYITQVWVRPNAVTHKLVADLGTGTLRTDFKFAKKRVFESYFEGEQLGYKPATKDVGNLIAIYDAAFNRSLSARAMVRELSQGFAKDGHKLVVLAGRGDVVKPDPKKPVPNPAFFVSPNVHPDGAVAADGRPYVVLNHSALRGHKYVGKTEGGNPVIMQADFLVHPDFAGKLKNVLGRSWLREYAVTRGLLKAQSFLKQTKLSISLFHQTQEGIHALFHRTSPFTAPDINLSDPHQWALVSHGLQIADHQGYALFSEGLSGAGGLFEKAPFVGKYLQQYNEYLFKDYIPRIKMQMALHALERNRTRYSGDLSDDQILEMTSNQANAAFGELNYRMLARNKSWQDFWRLTLLAPDFLEARARFVGQALKPYGREQQAALLLMGATMFIGARILNKILDDDYHWDRPFTVIAGRHEFGLRTLVGDVQHLVTDPRRFLMNRVSPLVRTAIELGTSRDERGVLRSGGEQFKDFAAWLRPIAFDQKDDAKWWQQVLGATGVRAATVTADSQINALAHEFNKKTGHASILDNYGIRPESDYRKLRVALQNRDGKAALAAYRALEDGGKSEAHILGYFLNRVNHPFTGSAAQETAFKETLSARQEKLYEQAVEERTQDYDTLAEILR
jgi:N12 class adenine-specific DNA methylase